MRADPRDYHRDPCPRVVPPLVRIAFAGEFGNREGGELIDEDRCTSESLREPKTCVAGTSTVFDSRSYVRQYENPVLTAVAARIMPKRTMPIANGKQS